MMHLASSPDLSIYVCDDLTGTFNKALEILSKDDEVILDETAVATLFMLKLHKSLGKLPYRFTVPESLLVEIRRLIKQTVFYEK